MASTKPYISTHFNRLCGTFAISLLVFMSPASLRASTFQKGDITSILGPNFLIDNAANGGGDADINQPNAPGYDRSFTGQLAANQGPTRVTLTGFGFATHTSATANDATSVALTFTYLGADEIFGGGDDVVMGTVTGGFTFLDPQSILNPNAEYALAFDSPLVSDLIITGTKFRIRVAPSNANSNGSLKLKTPATGNIEAKLSVAGVAAPLIIPQRVNLAKYQPVTVTSFAGYRLASFATDGDTGFDSRWQSNSDQWNSSIITFPFPVEIGSAQVFSGVNETLVQGNYGLQSWNGTTWVNIPGGSVSSNTSGERNIVFTIPVTSTQFRLLSQAAPQYIREIALYPPNGISGYPIGTDLKVNLALQRPAVATAHTAGQFPINAVDGRTHAGSSWQTTTAGVNTLDIEMVANTKIGSVHLYSGSSTAAALGNFTLKSGTVSGNVTTWADIPGGTVVGNTDLDRVITFTAPPTTTLLRLEFTHSGASPTIIRELQIFPANSGNAGYPLGTNVNPSGAYANYETFNDAFYQITNFAADLDVAVATGGQPALEPAGITIDQARYQVLLNLTDGTYRLRNWDTGECLSGSQLSKTAGAALTDEPYVAMPHQDWILEPLGGRRYQIINVWSGLAIDTQAGATAQGTALVQNTRSSATSQQWIFNYDTWAPKKGLGHSTAGGAFNADWVYNWGSNKPSNLREDVVFNPMQWGSYNWTYNFTFGPIWQRTSEWRKRGDGMILMGFNEPDRTDQSNIPVATAVNLWPQVMALNQPLTGPSPADDGTWLTAFTSAAKARGFRWEYTAIHAYPGPGGNSDGLINGVQQYYDNYDLPVWLTEFSFVDWAKNQSWSEENCYQTLAEFLWRAEGMAALRKYALFVFTANTEYPQPANSYSNYTPAPRSNSYDESGNLTAFGRLYAAWDSDTTIRAGKTYLIHNRGLGKRMANAATTNTAPGGRTIRTDGPIVNWTLASTPTANRYYVVSSIDGRLLSHTTGTGVAPTLAAPGTTGSNVEWSLTETQHGWHYLGHPASNTRLKFLSFNPSTLVASYQMVATTTTDNNTQWRFIVPLSGDNVAPVLAPISNGVVNEFTPFTLTASATDTTLPNGPLVYSLVNPASNSSINPSTGAFTWTPSETQGNGSPTSFTIRASDGQLSTDRTFTITANEINSAPTLASIPNQTIDEGTQLTFTATTTDADLPANTLTYSLISPPAGASINGSTGVFTWTPSEAQGPGGFNFTVRVSDGALMHEQLVSVTVNEVSTAPVLAVITPKTVNEGNQLSFTATATDVDIPSTPLTFSLVSPPAGASINGSTGVFTWTPTEAQGPGSLNVTVRVSDGILIHDRLVAVTINEVNVAPVLAVIPSKTVNEGTLLTFTATATDTDLPANTLTFSLVSPPAGASINGSTGVFAWTPTESQGPDSLNLTVRVSDGNQIHDRLVAVTVNEVNVAPVLATIPPKTVNEGSLLGFTTTATDADLPANTLTYSLVSPPVGASINGNTGAFTWTPTEAQGPGSFNLTVRVSDGNSIHEQLVAVTVNEAPVLAAIPPQTVDEGTLLTFTATATDADLPANTLTFSLVSPPVGASINGSTGVFTWTPTGAQGPGDFNITVSVSDGNQSDDQVVSVTVESPLPEAGVDTDGDGLSDLLEHAFMTDPAVPNGNPFRAIQANAGSITLEFPWNWGAAGLSWQLRHGGDLSNPAAWPVVDPGPTTVVREGDVDRVTISPTMSHPGRGFYILEVIGN